MNTAAKACGSVREIPGRMEALECLSRLLAGRSRAGAQALLVLVDEAAWALENGDPAAADRFLQAAYADLHRHVPPQARAFRWSGTALLAVYPAGAAPASSSVRARHAKSFALKEFHGCDHLARAMDTWIGRNLFERSSQPSL